MHPDELTLPLWRLVWRWAVRRLTFADSTERWSNLSPAQRAERRAHWPPWRRAVRPLGLAVIWTGVICSVALGDDSKYVTLVRIGEALVLLPIGCISIRDWLRDLWSEQAASSASSAARGSDPAPSHSSPPGVATEQSAP
jgi:hypothetical protein